MPLRPEKLERMKPSYFHVYSRGRITRQRVVNSTQIERNEYLLKRYRGV